MANEGYLGRITIDGERAATDGHPTLIDAVPLSADAVLPMEPGCLLKRVEEKKDGVVVGYAYAPWAESDTDGPCAVVDKPCDPTGESAETSAIAVLHGTVKRRILKVGAGDGTPPGAVALQKLAIAGIYPV